MKKLFCLFVCIILILLCGCKNKSSDVTAVTTGLKFTAVIDYGGKSYECDVEIPKNSNIIIKAVNPESLNGMIYNFSDSGVKIDFNGLTYDTDITALPKNSVFGFIYDIFRDADKNKENVKVHNDDLLITGKTGAYEYNMFLGSSGLPIKIEAEENGITAFINRVTIV